MTGQTHQFKITYCVTCGFKPRAIELQTELRKAFGQEAEMVQAEGGLFEVEDGSALLFSKHKEDRFPEPGEVINVVKALAEGLPIDQAREKGQASNPKPPTFEEWFLKRVEGK